MEKNDIEKLRFLSRKLLRELGILQLDVSDPHITPGHWHALIEIEHEPGLTISELGNRLLLTPSSVSRLVRLLSQRGLVDFTNGLDKREKCLHLTQAGKARMVTINAFSQKKIEGAFRFLDGSEMAHITQAIEKYANALEESRRLGSDIKIVTLSTSRTLRKQIMELIFEIQKNEFNMDVDEGSNTCILKAEAFYYYNSSYNFWYAVNGAGKIVGCIGLKRVNADYGEVKKFFLLKDYRGSGVADQLICTLLSAARKHGFENLCLGSVSALGAAHRFYEKKGFKKVTRAQLPQEFEPFPLDSVFYEADLQDVMGAMSKG